MPFPGSTQGTHDDTQHTGSAKRNGASGLKGIDASLNLTPKLLMADIDAAILNAINGIPQLDGSGLVAMANLPVNIANGIAGLNASSQVAVANLPVNTGSGIQGLDSGKRLSLPANDLFNPFPFAFLGDLGHARIAFAADFTVIQGTYANSNTVNQTDWDDLYGLGQPGYTSNTSAAVNDQLNTTPDIRLTAGTYAFTLSTTKTPDSGILEILWYSSVSGNVSLGTWDLYAAAQSYNNVITVNYSPTQRYYGHFILRSTTKNGSSTGYRFGISRINIRRTA